MRHRIAIAALLAVTVTGGFGHAADPRYPDWPCAQAKVPEISLAAVWAGPPLDDVSGKWKDDAKVSALVAKLAARRTPLEEAQKAITEYLNGAADKTGSGKLLFAGLFDSLNAQRSQVLNGLERVTRKQREAADKIRADTLALQALQGASAARSSQDRRARQSACVADAHLRGPAEVSSNSSARCRRRSTSVCSRSGERFSRRSNSR